jgi:hypothetical protein
VRIPYSIRMALPDCASDRWTQQQVLIGETSMETELADARVNAMALNHRANHVHGRLDYLNLLGYSAEVKRKAPVITSCDEEGVSFALEV